MKIPPGFRYLIPAGLLALLSTYLVHQYITAKTTAVVQPRGQILVAEVDIPSGAAVAARMIKTANWPKEIIPATAIRTPEQVLGRVVQVPISRGEPILTTKLSPEGTAAGMGGLLDPNKLAMAVRIDDVSGVAGFINPGDRVDILVEMPALGGTQEHFSKLLLQNIRVLSRGQTYEQTSEKKPEVVNTVTLEVSPDQAEVLNLASFQGKIRLALRNKINREDFATRGVLTSQITLKPSAAPPAAPGKRGPEKTVEIIKGTNRSTAEF